MKLKLLSGTETKPVTPRLTMLASRLRLAQRFAAPSQSRLMSDGGPRVRKLAYEGSRRLELFKFCVYLSIPAATVLYWNKPENLESMIKARAYVTFPKEDERPPAGGLEELRAFAKQRAEKKAAAAAEAAAEAKASNVVAAASPE